MTFLRQNWPIFEDAHPPIKKLTIFKQNGKVPFWPIFAKTDQNISTFCHFWPNQKSLKIPIFNFQKNKSYLPQCLKNVKLISGHVKCWPALPLGQCNLRQSVFLKGFYIGMPFFMLIVKDYFSYCPGQVGDKRH